jgi:hypothetical protein
MMDRVQVLISSFDYNFNSRRYIKGVCWDKAQGKWKAECKGKRLGLHATEAAAAQARKSYVEDGGSLQIDPIKLTFEDP